MKLLMKEWKLCMHPTGYIMLLCAALVLVPGYPYTLSCFYMGLAIYFICLTARENHDASYTLTLPVSRGDAVRARILFCTVLEILDLLPALLQGHQQARKGFCICRRHHVPVDYYGNCRHVHSAVLPGTGYAGSAEPERQGPVYPGGTGAVCRRNGKECADEHETV